MRPFSTIAIPHRDILEGRLTMDVFAADLWKVFKGEAPEEYQNPDVFFRKTYLTSGLKNLLDIAKKRLDGRGGDPVIQLQTPFGGGKTHALIALYHEAREWKANVVVIDGTILDPKEITIWEEIESQLEGEVHKLKGKISPGRQKLEEVLSKHQPLLILIDELLEYTAKASGVKVDGSNLASQTLAFIQEITMTVSGLEKSLLMVTLPSSLLAPYDENTEKLFRQLQHIVGRTEKIYTPVQEEEIAQVVRRRLFSNVNEELAKDTIEEFLDYAEKEKILPEGVEKGTYREKFVRSFPFQPEVIDVLYKRWGSFPTFQRTRGVLRILALVVHSLKDSKNPFIRLGDFDLKNDEIKRELIKHIGPEYDSIIAADITSNDAGSKKVDKSLGESYSPFSFGTKSATAIFMYSFSGGPEKGATINEIKLSCADLSTPSSIVVEAINKLRENLFYLSDTGLFFTNQPNLNHVLLTKMESIEDLKSEERELLRTSFGKEYFDIYIWPHNSKDIPDTKRLKLVILRDCERCKEFLENHGGQPRVNRNTLIFLCPLESERIKFDDFLKKKIAWSLIENDKTLRLKEEQKKEVKEKVRKFGTEVREQIRNLYRIVLLPSKDGFKEIDLGISTFGVGYTIDKEIYERLRNDGEILESLSPRLLQGKYLKDKVYVETKNILDSFYTTPGEIRISKDDMLKEAIKKGVKEGLFGAGIIKEGKPISNYFKKDFSPELVEGEIIMRADLCIQPTEAFSDEKLQSYITKIKECNTIEGIKKIQEEITQYEILPDQRKKIENEIKRKIDELKGEQKEKYQNINLKLKVPVGKLSDIVRIVNYIKSKFNQTNITVEISAQDGEIAISDYEDKIKEAIFQAGMSIEMEDIE